MTHSLPFAVDTHPRPGLTPRQDRLEANLARAIANDSPRSTLRETVVQLVDHLRLQGVPASRGIETITEAARRVSNAVEGVRPSATRLPIDCPTLVSTWASARYARAD